MDIEAREVCRRPARPGGDSACWAKIAVTTTQSIAVLALPERPGAVLVEADPARSRQVGL